MARCISVWGQTRVRAPGPLPYQGKGEQDTPPCVGEGLGEGSLSAWQNSPRN